MVKKTSAYYQREYRKRLREQGLIKKEIWINPGNSKVLVEVEKYLRTSLESNEIGGLMEMNKSSSIWNTESLHVALLENELIKSGKASVELIEGVDASIVVTMNEYGDLPIFISVSGHQIVAESFLWSISDVNNVAEFNSCVLRTHKYFPLSTISLESSKEHGSYYHMFGALSASSILENIILEIETLADNVINAADAFKSFLKTSEKKAV